MWRNRSSMSVRVGAGSVTRRFRFLLNLRESLLGSRAQFQCTCGFRSRLRCCITAAAAEAAGTIPAQVRAGAGQERD